MTEIDHDLAKIAADYLYVADLAERAKRLEEALLDLVKAYVNLLEVGRDRIVSLGGCCDPVDRMESDDVHLCRARAALASPRNKEGS